VELSNYAAVTGAPAIGYNASALTPAVGFVARPWKELSFFGNYIQALQQGSVVGLPFANAGTTLPPFVASQFEIGAKIDLGNFGATLSAFQITRASVITNTANNTQTADGQQVNKGIELTLFGEPIPGFRPLGGITLLDPRQTQTTNGLNNGKLAPGASTVQLNLGAEWDLPWVKGLSLQGRMIHTGQSYVDAANTQGVSAWTRFDVGARYTFERRDGKPVTLRANVTNLFDMNYWMAPLSTLTEGAPRTVMISLTSDF
jgi:iron complex outermembrane receptor protein